MKRFLIVIAVIAVILLIGDYVLRGVAENAAADLIDEQIAQEVEPEVELGGFPFLRSVLTGTFDEITITIPDVAQGPLLVEDIVLTLRDVRLEALEVLAGRGDLRAASLKGRGVISESTLNEVVGAQYPGLTITIEKDRVSVSRNGTTVAANAVVAGNRLLFQAGELAAPLEVPLPELLPEVLFSSLRATPGELVLQVIGTRVRVRT